MNRAIGQTAEEERERLRLKRNEYQSRYAKRHRKQENARYLAWRETNREKYRAWGRDHYAKNKARILAGQRARKLAK